MSLMGVVMLTGIAVSNSILIVEFTRVLREQGHGNLQFSRLGASFLKAHGTDGKPISSARTSL